MTNELSVEEAVELLKEKRMEINYQVNGTTRFSKALDIAIKAVEKDIAKEPIQTQRGYGRSCYCPKCDEFLGYKLHEQEGSWSRCRNCGQKIKWGGSNSE